MKKKKVIITAAVIALVAVIGGTLAYFTDEYQFHTYIYALMDDIEEDVRVLKKVKAGETTPTVFDYVQVSNKIGNGMYDFKEDSYNIKGKAYAIQSDGISQEVNSGLVDSDEILSFYDSETNTWDYATALNAYYLVAKNYME